MLGLQSKVFIAGHRGMVGSAIYRMLTKEGFKNILTASSKTLDLRNQADVRDFFLKHKPEIVIDCAAKVGGIMANKTYPYQFIMDNLQIQNNLINESHLNDVQKFIFLGSSCIYPKLAPQPLKEEYLLTGPLETTNEFYAIAKIAGLKACESIRKQYGKSFISLMPTNLYGPFDNFNLSASHVMPALIRKFIEAKQNNIDKVILWGTGTPLREFLYVDDLADAVFFILKNNLNGSIYNVGSGDEVSIENLAMLIKKILNCESLVEWNLNFPDGTPRKKLDTTELSSLGWGAKTNLEKGIELTIDWYLNNYNNRRDFEIV